MFVTFKSVVFAESYGIFALRRKKWLEC